MIFLKLVLQCASLILLLCLCGCNGASSSGKKKPKMHLVEIRQMQFQPSELVIPKGDSVTFINKDLVVHDITEEKEKSWQSSALSPNQHYKMVVLRSADYYCSIHPMMKGKLRVL